MPNLIPPIAPSGMMPDLTSEIDKYKKAAASAAQKAATMSMVGNIISGAGMLGGLINSIYQGSKGRNPIDIGTPISGMGQVVSNVGQGFKANAASNLAQGMMGELKKSYPTAGGMLEAYSYLNPEAAIKSGVTALTKDPKSRTIIDILEESHSSDPVIAKKAREILDTYSKDIRSPAPWYMNP